MGIKGLWNILAPYSEKISLHEIRGENIAVDLSGWVCDSQNVTDYYVQPKLYLRNLFFRTIYLLLAEINPIFVLEGDAPELKQDVMAARNALQFRGAAPKVDNKTTNKKPDVGRRRFKGVLKECESLLKCMGVRCVKGTGEAEATCAQLNAQGLVHAVVSQDSDCFAYGARRVYRNFSVSSAAGGGALAGSVDCYDSDKMYKDNGFGRNKMVALALLCGCDYGPGACGSSITTVVSFLHTVPDEEILPRLLSWASNTEKYESLGRWAAVPGRCERCGHAGRHAKNGCPVCVTPRACHDTGHKAKLAEVKRELSLRTRALSSEGLFPQPRVITEFLSSSDDKIDINTMACPTPNLVQFVKLMSYKLDWSERYCVEKFLPLLTKWHLQEHIPCRTIRPVKINKKRNPRGIPSFEVLWTDINGEYENLISDDQFAEGEEPLSVWTTTERQDLMRQYYPEVVEVFEESIKKPPKEKKTRARKKNDNPDKPDKPKRKYNKKVKAIQVEIDNLNTSMKNISLSAKPSEFNSSKLNVSVSVNKLKRKLKTKSKQKTIDSFIANKRRKSSIKEIQSLRHSFRKMSINLVEHEDDFKCKDKENKRLLRMSQEDIGDSDLSDIIDKIVSRAPMTETAVVDKQIYKLVFDKYSTPKKSIVRKSVLSEIRNNCSTPKDSPVRRNSFRFCPNTSDSVSNKADTSYFFDKFTGERDAFEISMDYKHNSAIVNLDSTVDCSLPKVFL